MTNKPYPCRIGNKRFEKIETVSQAIDLSFPETLRRAVDEGLPIVKRKFAKKK